MENIKAIIFDGDDTLWLTEYLYDDARREARTIVEGLGLNGARWEELAQRLDQQNVAVFGFSPQRFPTSCAAGSCFTARATLVFSSGASTRAG